MTDNVIKAPSEVGRRAAGTLRSPAYRFGMLAAFVAMLIVPALSFLFIGGLVGAIAYVARPLIPFNFRLPGMPALGLWSGLKRSVSSLDLSSSVSQSAGQSGRSAKNKEKKAKDDKILSKENKDIPKGRKTGEPMVDLLVKRLEACGLTVSTDWAYAKKVLKTLDPKYDFFNQHHKKVYGFVYKKLDGDGNALTDPVIYINPDHMSLATPIHEYTHVWAEALRHSSPDEWKHIVSLLKNEKKLWKSIEKAYPHLSGDDEIADEVLATYSGSHGREVLRQFYGKGDDAESAIGRVEAALVRFWKDICGFMGWHYSTLDDVCDKVLSDLLTGVNPLSYTDSKKKRFFDLFPLHEVRQHDVNSEKTMERNTKESNIAALMSRHCSSDYGATFVPVDIRVSDQVYGEDKPRRYEGFGYVLDHETGMSGVVYEKPLSPGSSESEVMFKPVTDMSDQELETLYTVMEKSLTESFRDGESVYVKIGDYEQPEVDTTDYGDDIPFEVIVPGRIDKEIETISSKYAITSYSASNKHVFRDHDKALRFASDVTRALSRRNNVQMVKNSSGETRWRVVAETSDRQMSRRMERAAKSLLTLTAYKSNDEDDGRNLLVPLVMAEFADEKDAKVFREAVMQVRREAMSNTYTDIKSSDNPNVTKDGRDILTGTVASKRCAAILSREKTDLSTGDTHYPFYKGSVGYFADKTDDGKKVFTAFDNTSGDMWVEDTRTAQGARAWIRGDISADEIKDYENRLLSVREKSILLRNQCASIAKALNGRASGGDSDGVAYFLEKPEVVSFSDDELDVNWASGLNRSEAVLGYYFSDNRTVPADFLIVLRGDKLEAKQMPRLGYDLYKGMQGNLAAFRQNPSLQKNMVRIMDNDGRHLCNLGTVVSARAAKGEMPQALDDGKVYYNFINALDNARLHAFASQGKDLSPLNTSTAITDGILLTEDSFEKLMTKSGYPPHVKFDEMGEFSIEMNFYDGYARDLNPHGLGLYDRVGLYYPTMKEVLSDPEKVKAVQAFTGRKEITPFDIALKYGEASRITCPQSRYDDAVKAIQERAADKSRNACFTQDQRDRIALAAACQGDACIGNDCGDDLWHGDYFVNKLFDSARPGMSGIPKPWQEDTLSELRDLADGKVREAQSQQLRY